MLTATARHPIVPLLIPVLLVSVGASLAATPPDLVNYQGVLRDDLDRPLTGDHDMVFRFWSADVGGDEILVDRHDALNGNPVGVSGGMFNVELGGGVLSDGSGPGTYASLAGVFRDYGTVYLGVEVGGEVLSPRIRIVAAGYALNASHLDGIDSAQVMRSDISDAFTSGTLTMDSGTILDVDGTLQMDGPVAKSTTDLVANFNADLLDGNEASAFATAVHGHPGSDISGPVAQATNADTVDGKHASDLIDTSSAAQSKVGPLTVDAGALPTSTGVTGLGTDSGGFFQDSDGSGHAYVGNGDHGIRAFGSLRGGYFGDVDSSGYAEVASGEYGISAYGNEMGGYFEDRDGSGYAKLGFNNWGIRGFGSGGGGYFEDLDSSAYADVARGDRGIEAFGNVMGAKFQDLDSSGVAHVAYGDRGIEAFGNDMGGYFEDADGTGYAYVGYLNYGIQGFGLTGGAYFEDFDNSGYGYIGSGDYGVWGGGDTTGGYFLDTNSSGYAYVGYGALGIEAQGNTGGGYFKDSDSSGYAYVGYGNRGIEGFGNLMGATFRDLDSSGYAYLAYGDTGVEAYGLRGVRAEGSVYGGSFSDSDSSSFIWAGHDTYKVWGVGSVDFVQNHPYDDGLVITYAAPEGDEVATYTRGTARLINGEARVRLGETFEWVTNPDIGLTAWVTPVGDWSDLYVAEKSTTELVVRSRAGAPDVEFDYIVYGLRIGFEEVSVLQEKEVEAFIPSMNSHDERYAKRPELRSYNALERFKRMHTAVTGTDAQSLDLSASLALRDAIHEYDPASDPPVHELFGHGRLATGASLTPTGAGGAAAGTEPDTQPRASSNVSIGEPRVTTGAPGPVTEEPLPDNVFPVSQPVEPGDLLVIDLQNPGKLCRAETAADPGVVGIVAAEPFEHDGALVAPLHDTQFAYVKADASFGVILAGDLLTTSPTPGHAMVHVAPPPGAAVAKALEPLDSGTGLIKVLVMAR